MKRPSLSDLGAGLVAALLLAGCTHAPEAPARLGLRLPPAALGTAISVQQHLTVERPGGTNDLDVALEVDAAHVGLVGLAFGQRVLSLDYDGTALKEWRHAMLPAQVRAADRAGAAARLAHRGAGAHAHAAPRRRGDRNDHI